MDISPRAAEAATSEINALLSPMLDDAITEARKKEYSATRGSGIGQVAAKRIGAGYIGEDCNRCLGFQYHKFPKETRDGGVSPGELTRHAEAGHWTENKTLDWLGMVGLNIQTVMTNDYGNEVIDQWGKPKQIGWMDGKDPETGQYRLAGEVDGVIMAVDDHRLATLIKPPCIWESKKATDKKWKKFAKETVKNADKKYYGQLQTNMGYLGIRQTLFSMLNLDTMKFYFELVPFDQLYAQTLVNRAVDTFATKTPFELSRLGKSEDDWVCKFCDYKTQCWHEGASVHVAPQSGFFNPNDMEDPPF
jgi:hypothetical protein